LTLSSAAHLPSSIPAGQVLVITLNDIATEQNFEVIYATSVSGATLSGLLRGQEGTAALAWSTGDFAYSAPTAGQQASFGQLAENNAWSGNQAFTGTVTAQSTVSVTGQISSSNTNTWTGANTFTQSVNVTAAVAPGQAVNLGQIPAQFPSSITANGYKKYPDPNSPSGYFIEQWGFVTLGNGSNQSVTLPISYPNGHLWAGCSYASVPSLNTVCGAATGTLSTILIGNVTPGTNGIYYQSKGY